MPQTLIQRIFATHTTEPVAVDAIVDLTIDLRAARDFGGANVVKHLKDHDLPIADPHKTLFTFDCNPGGCDQKYATNQHLCRQYARAHNIPVYDINSGIGTHLVVDNGLVKPGDTFVSTDSHANILGAIGAFGQGMGDIDIAYTFAHGTTWFKVPPTTHVIFTGTPAHNATAKDIVLRMTKETGASGLLGSAAELTGPLHHPPNPRRTPHHRLHGHRNGRHHPPLPTTRTHEKHTTSLRPAPSPSTSTASPHSSPAPDTPRTSPPSKTAKAPSSTPGSSDPAPTVASTTSAEQPPSSKARRSPLAGS